MMIRCLSQFVAAMRPAFSREAAHGWFVVAFVGMVLRSDDLGVTSIVRALALSPECYLRLLHFFHSSAWDVRGLMQTWGRWLMDQQVEYCINARIVLNGDHTKTPKDGRRIPAVTTLHQDSETATKPAFFRGHHWGCVALLAKAAQKCFAIPLEARIQEGLEALAKPGHVHTPKTILIVEMARRVVEHVGRSAYLVLDAYFAAGPVFEAAAQTLNGIAFPVHIVTRAKKNVVAYLRAPKKRKKTRGRKRKYGKKLQLMKLFQSRAHQFQTDEVTLYGKRERVRHLTLDLLWKPTKGTLRFILIESARGRIILISSDLDLEPLDALELYSRRVTIEVLFDTLKNTQAAMAYHFWSRYLTPASRRPRKNKIHTQHSTHPKTTRTTLDAIEKFVNLHLLVTGMLQVLAIKIPHEIKAKARCWLRTVTSTTPSEFVARNALANELKNNLNGLAHDPITQVIRGKQNLHHNMEYYDHAA